MAAASATLSELIRSLNRPLLPRPVDLPEVLSRKLGRELTPAPRAILFDIYGTLLISASGEVGSATDLTADAEAELPAAVAPFAETVRKCIPELAAAGGDVVGQLHDRYFAAIAEEHAEAKARGTAFPEVVITEIWQKALSGIDLSGEGITADRQRVEQIAVVYEQHANPTSAMPGAAETVSALARAGVVLGIVSNAQFYTQLVLEEQLGSSLSEIGFATDAICYSYRIRKAKPSQELFSAALAGLSNRSIEPSQVLYIGNDMRNDVAAAHRAGCSTCLFAGDARSLRLRHGDPFVDSIQPDTVITRLEQLLTVCGISEERQ